MRRRLHETPSQWQKEVLPVQLPRRMPRGSDSSPLKASSAAMSSAAAIPDDDGGGGKQPRAKQRSSSCSCRVAMRGFGDVI
jgi:hypothetical protein